jgi:histidinol phosphatase-like enzyme
MKIANKSLKNVAKLKFLGVIVTNQSGIHEEIKRISKLGNVTTAQFKIFLSSFLLSKNVKIRIYKNVIVSVVLCGYESQ